MFYKLFAFLLLPLVGVTIATAQVRITFHQYDTLKGRIKAMTEYRDDGTGTLKSVYTCNLDDRTETAVFYSSDNKLMGKWVAKFDDSGHLVNAGLYADSATLCICTKSHSFHTFRYTEKLHSKNKKAQ